MNNGKCLKIYYPHANIRCQLQIEINNNKK